MFSYLTNTPRGYSFKQYSGNQKLMMKEAGKLFTEYDLLCDSERSDSLLVYTNEQVIAKSPKLQILSRSYTGIKSPEQLASALKDCNMYIYQRDEKSMQEIVAGMYVGRDFREREFMTLGGEIFRYEISKKVLWSKFDNKLFGSL